MKKVYASIRHNPHLEKWKLNEVIVVEKGKVTGGGAGGSFFFGPEDVPGEVLKEALFDLLFFDPEEYGDYEDERWQEELKRLMREVKMEFVSAEEIKKLKEKYSEQT